MRADCNDTVSASCLSVFCAIDVLLVRCNAFTVFRVRF
jgi:hypothetical protein